MWPKKGLFVLVLEEKTMCRLLGKMITFAKLYFLQLLHTNRIIPTKCAAIRKFFFAFACFYKFIAYICKVV